MREAFPCENCDDEAPLPRGRQFAIGAFRTPSLRELANTAPYMHNGVYLTLEEAVAHYASAPEAPVGHTEVDPVPLDAGAQADVVAFLRSLSSVGGAPRLTP